MTAAEPGIDFRRTGILDADAEIRPDIEWTAPRFHRKLFDPHTNIGRQLTHAIVDVLDEQDAPLAALDEIGVTALDGLFAELCVQAVSETDNEALWNLLRTTRQLGSGQTSLDLRSSRDDLDTAAIPIFAASNVTPTIAIHLDGQFTDRKPEQRRDVLELCLVLAKGCRVHLVTSGLVGRFLWDQHRDQLPTSVTEQFDPRTTPSPGTPSTVAERVTIVRGKLDPDGTATAVLRALRAETAEMRSYNDLSRELGLSAENCRQIALKLDQEFGLAERIDYPGGGRGLSLRPAGDAYLDAIDEEIGRQQYLPTGESDSVMRPPNSSEYSRVTPHAHEGEPDDGTDQPADNRPTNEGVAITATRNRPRGYVQSVYLDWPSHDGARLAADPSEIALVDAPTTELKRRDGQEDFRAMGWSYDEDNSDLVVAAKYTNPMQYWTCIGRALTSTWTWDRVLTEDVLADIFSKYSLRILRDARNIGGLSEERYDDPAAFIEYYQQQEQRLCDLTREWYHGDYDDANKMRSEITRLAKGLSGSIAQLLDLADIGLVREVRLPEFSRNWSDKQRRQTLVRTLAHSCSIESLYGHFVAYRQLYEQRDRHRKAAIDPEVDACDPLGELVGSLVVVGPGVPDLENELRSALRSPGELHDDAPEIAVQIPIRASTSRSVIARTVRRMCDRKGIEATREAVSLFEGFVTTSYDVARAIHYGLEQEDRRQEIHIDEVRRALAHLDPGRLLANADVKPTMQKALSVLLGADRPLSGAAIAHRAGITTESFRKNRTEFVVADLLREVPEGWRLSLSFADERYGRDVLPWFFIDDPDNRPYFSSLDLRVTRDVLYEFLISIVDDPARFGDPDDVLYRAFVGRSDRWARGLDGLCDEWPWLRSILPLVRAACESPEDSGMDPVLMGPTPSQQPFTTVSNKTVG